MNLWTSEERKATPKGNCETNPPYTHIYMYSVHPKIYDGLI